MLMNKLARIAVIILCICMLFSGSCLQGFAARTNTSTMFRLYGDVNGNGKVEMSDYEEILAYATGAKAKPAVGTPEYYAADIMGDGITMEDARRCYRYVKGLDTADTYSPKDRDVELFNDLVNVIKSDNFKANEFMAYYSYVYDHMEINNFEFGSLTNALKDLWNEDEGDTETYSVLRKNQFVYATPNTAGGINTNFPGAGREVVSTLTPDQVKNIRIEVGVPCTFSEDMGVPDSYATKTTTYDLTSYKQKEAGYTDCIKITVEIRDESYRKDVATLPEGKKSALYNFYGIDKTEEASYYPFESTEGDESLGSLYMRIELNDMRTSAYAVYYFDRATLNPMAAGYYVEEDATQKATLKVEFLGSTLEGSMEPRELIITKYHYWFGSFFG